MKHFSHLTVARWHGMITSSVFVDLRQRISGLETLFVENATSHDIIASENMRLHGNVTAVGLQVEQMQAQIAAQTRENKDLHEQIKASEESNNRLKRRVSELETDKKTTDTMNSKLIVEMQKVVNTIGSHKLQKYSTEGERHKIVT